MTNPKAKPLKFKQIVTGQFEGMSGGCSYMIIGLSEEGKVYRYEKGMGGWVELNHVVVPKEEF